MAEDADITIAMIGRRRDAILETWTSSQLASGLRADLINRDELAAQSRDFLDAFVAAFSSGSQDISSAAFRPVVRMLEALSVSRTRQGFSPTETATYVFSLKNTLVGFLQEEYVDQPETLTREIVRLSLLLDGLGLVTFEAYVKGREEVILRQQQELLELSTPVIKVWEGVLSLPLIGTLDSARTQIVMENLLQQIVVTGSSIAILDISGVPAVDTLVAQHLLKTVSATRLMGADCIISGIRPEIAQTMVGLGVDLSSVRTKASMAEALKEALRTLGVKVVKGDGGVDRR